MSKAGTTRMLFSTALAVAYALSACGQEDAAVIQSGCGAASCPGGTLLELSDSIAERCEGVEWVVVESGNAVVTARCLEIDACVYACVPPLCCGEEHWEGDQWSCLVECCADGSAPPCKSVCGDGECGADEFHESCPADCVCVPQCADRQCDSDGCGGLCGVCPDPWKDICHSRCQDGKCVPLQLEDEVCDGEDNDCDGQIDEGLELAEVYTDLDGDGFGASGIPATTVCLTDADGDGEYDLPAGYSEEPSDCNDAFSVAYPGAPELCDGILNDCDAPFPDYQCPFICEGEWPVAVGVTYGMAVPAQMNFDNFVEVVVQGNGKVSVFDFRGENLWEVPADVKYSLPVLADLTGDFVPDIVIAETQGVRVLDGFDGSTVESYDVNSSNARPVCVQDLDNDGIMDIVSPANGVLSVILRDGSGGAKDVLSLDPPVDGSFVTNSTGVFDIDGDGVAEVVVPTGYASCGTPGHPACHGYLLFYDLLTGKLKFDPAEKFVVPDAGTAFAGGSRPLIGDADGDGEEEVMVWFAHKGDDGQLMAWNRDGSLVEPPLPFSDVKLPQLVPLLPSGALDLDGQKPVNSGGPVVDLDSDGDWETVTTDEDTGYLVLLQGGELMDGYPVQVRVSDLVVSDLNLDGALDVVFLGSESGALHCYTLGQGTFSPERVLHYGSDEGQSMARYRTGNIDPYEPNDSRQVPFVAASSPQPIAASRAFPISGMLHSVSSSDGIRRRVRALLGTKGDRDFYWAQGTQIRARLDVLVEVVDFDLLMHVYRLKQQDFEYLGSWSSQEEGDDELVCNLSTPCPGPEAAGHKFFILEVAPKSAEDDWGLWPYTLTVDWAE